MYVFSIIPITLYQSNNIIYIRRNELLYNFIDYFNIDKQKGLINHNKFEKRNGIRQQDYDNIEYYSLYLLQSLLYIQPKRIKKNKFLWNIFFRYCGISIYLEYIRDILMNCGDIPLRVSYFKNNGINYIDMNGLTFYNNISHNVLTNNKKVVKCILWNEYDNRDNDLNEYIIASILNGNNGYLKYDFFFTLVKSNTSDRLFYIYAVICTDMYLTIMDYIYYKYSDITEEKLDIAINITKAVNYMHKNGIIHLDLKPENVLIDIEKSKVFIIDFGTSVIINNYDPNSYLMNTKQIGTLLYQAPEMNSDIGVKYKNLIKCDIYSLSIMLSMIVYDEYNHNIIKNILESRNDEFTNLINQMIIYRLELNKVIKILKYIKEMYI